MKSRRTFSFILVVVLILAINLVSVPPTSANSDRDVTTKLPDIVTDVPSTLASGTWAIIGPKDQIPQMKNLFWLFGNQSIPYVHLYHYQVKNYTTIKNYVGLVVWTNLNNVYNFTAVKLFAKTKPVISHIFDFCHYLYPSLSNGLDAVNTWTITYAKDWGNFRVDDKPETHNGTNYITTIQTTSLAIFRNITTIATVGSDKTAFFYMKGNNDYAGFYTIDLYTTRPDSYEAGNWHLFPAIAKASPLALGLYARWMTYGPYWRSLDWICNWMTDFALVNDDIVVQHNIGTSVNGQLIKALFVGKGTKYFITDAAIHGNEKAGSHALLRFAELLVEWYCTRSEWTHKLSQYTVIVIPILNPDGYVAETRENAHGIDLNRQFPPVATTTEPEAWALRWLMGNYTPTQYVNLHTGGETYPMDVYYMGSSPYGTYASWAVNEGNLMFQDLKHWGVFYGIWVGSYAYIGSIGSSSESVSYAFYRYDAAALLEEWWGVPKHNLHAQEFYISTLLALLQHHDREGGFMIYSNAFITKSTFYDAVGLTIELDATYIASNRAISTKIYDFSNRGKPKFVEIDGVRKNEGDGWSYVNGREVTISVASGQRSIYIGYIDTKSPDINGDGLVDIKDAALIGVAWMATVDSPRYDVRCDLNGDGIINIEDVTIFSNAWKSV
jgi:hypothetical protein